MTDITIRRDSGSSRPGKKPKGVTTKRVTTADGDKVTIRSIDANSPTFGDDLLYVFARNVEAARKANKAILGTPSGVRKPK